jgi:starch synthase
MSNSLLKILFVTPEIEPYAKTGGLADMVNSLTSALKQLGVEVRIVIPFYRSVKERIPHPQKLIKELFVDLSQTSSVKRFHLLESLTSDGIPLYLIEKDEFFDRMFLYGTPSRGDYEDNLQRFSFFCHASIRMAEAIHYKPDLIHCHDWQTALIPALLKGPYKESYLAGTPTVFTIHNLAYQGIFPTVLFPETGLSYDAFFHPEGLEFWGAINVIKAGIVYSDAITTVSPRYSQEILKPEWGYGLHGLLEKRKDCLRGILNRIDQLAWNPETDRHIPHNYSLAQLAGKHLCKEALLSELGFSKNDSNIPLLGMIGRFSVQKGFSLLFEIIDELMKLPLRLVILGSGDSQISGQIHWLTSRYPESIKTFIEFNEPLAHRIEAGCDMFLMPSYYEPCGLNQMYSLRYGTIPIVHATGGLDSSVVDILKYPFDGTGFKFYEYSSSLFLDSILQAVQLFQDPRSWNRLIANAMSTDLSWERSAKEYLDLYQSLVRK